MLSLRSKSFLKFWFPVALYSGIIFFISGISRIEVPFAQFNLDKLVHGLEYAILGYLFSRAMTGTSKVSKQSIFLVTMVFCILYGISDEFHQAFVPGRDATWTDALADAIGGTIGGIIYLR